MDIIHKGLQDVNDEQEEGGLELATEAEWDRASQQKMSRRRPLKTIRKTVPTTSNEEQVGNWLGDLPEEREGARKGGSRE